MSDSMYTPDVHAAVPYLDSPLQRRLTSFFCAVSLLSAVSKDMASAIKFCVLSSKSLDNIMRGHILYRSWIRRNCCLNLLVIYIALANGKTVASVVG